MLKCPSLWPGSSSAFWNNKQRPIWHPKSLFLLTGSVSRPLFWPLLFTGFHSLSLCMIWFLRDEIQIVSERKTMKERMVISLCGFGKKKRSTGLMRSVILRPKIYKINLWFHFKGYLNFLFFSVIEILKILNWH